MIDWNPRVQKWRQVADLIRERIKSGEYRPETRISEVQLEAELGVSRPTIRKGMALLREEGWIVTVPAMGSFIAETLPGQEDQADA